MMYEYYLVPVAFADLFKRIVLCVFFESDEPELIKIELPEDQARYAIFSFDGTERDHLVVRNICRVFSGHNFHNFKYAYECFKISCSD